MHSAMAIIRDDIARHVNWRRNMKAIKITTADNVISVVATVPEPTWKGMGELVGGGLFEIVRPWGLYNLDTPYKEQLCMIVNEEGQANWIRWKCNEEAPM